MLANYPELRRRLRTLVTTSPIHAVEMSPVNLREAEQRLSASTASVYAELLDALEARER